MLKKGEDLQKADKNGMSSVVFGSQWKLRAWQMLRCSQARSLDKEEFP